MKYVDFILMNEEPIRFKKKEIIAYSGVDGGSCSAIYLRGISEPFIVTAKYNAVKEILSFKDKNDE